MPSPTFIGIGAQKAGTTWLFSMVAQHPDVVSGKRKELHYFNLPTRHGRPREWYEGEFDVPSDGVRGRAVGECTPAYLWTTGDPTALEGELHVLGVADRVAALYGPDKGHDLRLIVCLRHPVDRAISAINEIVKKGPRFGLRPALSIREAVHRRPSVVEKGRYASNLKAWLRHFPRQAFLFFVYEQDILPDTAKRATLHRVFQHIGVDPSFEPVGLTDRKNRRLRPFDIRARHAGRFKRHALRLVPSALRDHPAWDFPGDPEGEQWLWSVYEPEIQALEELLGRPLPWAPPQVASNL